MNSGIIGATVYAYKHKDYGDIFLILKDASKYTFFDITNKVFEAIYNYHSRVDKFEEMLSGLQEDYIYVKLTKGYTDQEGYTGTIEKSVPLQIKDFVKVAFESDYNQVIGD